MNIREKVVLITGASSGIGKACAKLFAESGTSLILTARRINLLEELADQLREMYQVDIYTFKLDVRDLNSVSKFYNTLDVKLRAVDILVNNAGLARGLSKIQDADVDNWEEMIDTNIKGLLYVTRTFIPQMVERKNGHIINIGSTAGHEVYPFGNVYAATKYAVKALTQSIRLDVLDKGIKVTSIDPGMVLTEFSKVRFSGDEERAAMVYDGIEPLSAEDVAEAVLFAATRPENVNINQIILTPIKQASSTQVYRGK